MESAPEFNRQHLLEASSPEETSMQRFNPAIVSESSPNFESSSQDYGAHNRRLLVAS